MLVIFMRDVMRSEFFGLALDEEDYIEVETGTEGVIGQDTFFGQPIEIVSIDDDSGFVYPKNSYKTKVQQ